MSWSRWAIASLLVVAALGTAVLWWRGRPERHLARAEKAVLDGDRDEALLWLAVPERARHARAGVVAPGQGRRGAGEAGGGGAGV